MDDWRSKMVAAAILASVLFLVIHFYVSSSWTTRTTRTTRTVKTSARAVGDCKKKPQAQKPSQNETTLFNFLRLVLYRLIHGFASLFGGQEAIEEYLGGILVPPGVETDDGDYKDYADEQEYKDDGDYY